MNQRGKRISEIFGVELPVIQAPMAGVQTSALAIAVSRAGAVGSLPCAMLTPTALKAELESLHSTTSAPINVNFFCHVSPEPDARREAEWRAALEPYHRELGIHPSELPTALQREPFSAELADVLEPYRPKLVSFHFGLPRAALLERVKRWGAKVLGCATTVEEARWLETHGADAIVAQGAEAGGHRGMFLSDDLATQRGTWELVPDVLRAVSVPVIAAGGIGDAAGVQRAMGLGVAGVQIGTAYLLCPEASTSAVHRAALKGEGARETAITNVFSGRPARGVVNRLMRELGPISERVPEFPRAAAALAQLRASAEASGSGDFSPLWSGQGGYACREIGAAVLTGELAAGL